MARLTQGFEYQPIIAPYAPPPTAEFREALDERSSVFDRNVGEMDKLDILASNIDVLDPDRDIKLSKIDKIRNDLNQVSSVGAENATNLVRAAARDFATDKDLKLASEMHAKEMQRQEDARQMKLKGITPYDFTEEYGGVRNTPNWTPKIEAGMDHLSDAKRYVGKIRDKFKNMGLSIQSQLGQDGVRYTYGVTGKGEVVTEEMLKERAGDVIDEFMQSSTGGEQYSRYAAFNQADPRDAAFQLLMTAGREQVGEKKDVDYQLFNKTDSLALSGGYPKSPPNNSTYEIGDNVRVKDAYGVTLNSTGFLSSAKNKIQAYKSTSTGSTGISNKMGQPTITFSGDYKNVISYDNKKIEENVRPDLEKALGLMNTMSPEKIKEKLDNAFNNTSKYIMDDPEFQEAIENYEEAIKDLNMTVPVTTTDMLRVSDRDIDKNFNNENVEKDIRNNFRFRDFMVIDDKGAVTEYTNEIRNILSDPKSDVKSHGLYSTSNQFTMNPDPDNPEMTYQKFFQPYSATVTDAKGRQFKVAVSRELTTNLDEKGVVLKMPITPRSAIATNKLHAQAMKNFGAVQKFDIDSYEWMDFNADYFAGKPTVRTYLSGKEPVFEVEGKVKKDGKTYIVKGKGSSTYVALEQLRGYTYELLNED